MAAGWLTGWILLRMTRTVLAVVCSLLVTPGLAAGQTGRTAIAAFLTNKNGGRQGLAPGAIHTQPIDGPVALQEPGERPPAGPVRSDE